MNQDKADNWDTQVHVNAVTAAYCRFTHLDSLLNQWALPNLFHLCHLQRKRNPMTYETVSTIISSMILAIYLSLILNMLLWCSYKRLPKDGCIHKTSKNMPADRYTELQIMLSSNVKPMFNCSTQNSTWWHIFKCRDVGKLFTLYCEYM